MSGMLKWAVNDAFRAMVDQAVKRKGRLCLVKDDGVYLMSFGKTAKENKVVYAEGLDPKADDWYDRAHAICGGDDFGEDFRASDFANALAKDAKIVKIKMTARSMAVSFFA